jgi:hypothetical protein
MAGDLTVDNLPNMSQTPRRGAYVWSILMSHLTVKVYQIIETCEYTQKKSEEESIWKKVKMFNIFLLKETLIRLIMNV